VCGVGGVGASGRTRPSGLTYPPETWYIDNDTGIVTGLRRRALVRRVALRDIATKTGFSINTVSRALNGKPDINQKLTWQTKRGILETLPVTFQ